MILSLKKKKQITFFGCDKSCYFYFSVQLMYTDKETETFEVFKSKGKNKLYLKY